MSSALRSGGESAGDKSALRPGTGNAPAESRVSDPLRERSIKRRLAFRRHRKLVALALAVALTYLTLSVVFSLLTPAWENNDEEYHVQYVEYVAAHRSPPPISVTNGTESHQPPLYYFVAAAWQRLLLISPFAPDPLPVHSSLPPPRRIYEVGHNYKAGERDHAVSVHLLRLVSIIAGLVTVLAALATGWLLTAHLATTAAIGLTVACWPKFLVVSSAVTNLSLVVALCAAAIPFFLLWRHDGRTRWAVATGVCLGAGALTEETALPIAGLMLLAMVAIGARRHEWRSPLLAVISFLLVCGWWYVRDDVVYGDFLASGASRAYMAPLFGGSLIRQPPSLSPSVLKYSLGVLERTVWYDGGWNQLRLPGTINVIFAVLVVASIAGALRSALQDRIVLALCAVASVIGWLLIVRSTSQAEGRYLFVAIVAWAALLVGGAKRLFGERRAALWLWPAAFVAADVYVLAAFLVPYARL